MKDASIAPKVSVVMVTRNVERYLDEAIDSVLTQTFSGLELIIADFGSTDRSKEICIKAAANDSRVRFHEIPSCSLVEARNQACSLAKGEFIAIMDADDISLPHRLETEIRFLREHPAVGLIGGAAEWVDGNRRTLWVVDFPCDYQAIKDVLRANCPYCHSTVVMRRELFLKVGGYRKVFTVSHDYDLWARLAEHTECANLAEVVVKYRVHGSQISLSRRRLQSLSVLAVQASSRARQLGQADPLDSVSEITPELLIRIGVSESQQQQRHMEEYKKWIAALDYAGEAPARIELLEDALRLKWKHVDKDFIADLCVTTAKLYWERGRRLRGLLLVMRATLLKPALADRFIRAAARRLHIRRLLKISL
jgi:hypothetical protein